MVDRIRGRSRTAARLALVIVVAASVMAPAAPAATPTVTEFRIPWTPSAPHGIATGWDGNLWFTQSARNSLGRISPAATSGTEMEEFAYGIPTEPAPYDAEGIAAGPDGNVWFALRSGIPDTDFWIGSMTPGSGSPPSQDVFELSAADAEPGEIAAGRDGRLWFTRGTANSFGRIEAALPFADQHVQIAPPPIFTGDPRGIALGPDGNMWLAWKGSIVRATGGAAPTVTEFPAGSAPQGIAAGPDGNLWFTEVGSDRIGRITPAGTITWFEPPAPFNDPFRIVAGPDGNIWFSEGGGGQIGRLTPYGDAATIEASIVAFPPVTTPSFQTLGIAAGPDGNLWFTRTDGAGRQIGRITTGLGPAQARTPIGAEPIAIPSSGNANPYPSTLTLSSLPDRIDSLRVDLYGLFHPWPEDLDLLLVGPTGQTAMLVSDAGFDRSVFGSTLTVDDDAPVAAPLNGILVSGRYRPTDHEPGESFPAPAPPGPYGADLSAFEGTNPNGTWRLFARDDNSGLAGRLLGWGLRVEPPPPPEPPPGGAGSAPPGGKSEPPRPDAAGAGFVAGTRQVLVDPRGRALVELTCPAALRRSCPVSLGGSGAVPRRRGRRVRAAIVVASRRFTVPEGKVRAVALPLPRRLRNALTPRGLRLRLIASDGGMRTSASVSLRPATAEIQPDRRGRVRVLVPHPGDAKSLGVRVSQGPTTLARATVAKPRPGRVLPLAMRLRRPPRGTASIRVAVTTRPRQGSERTLVYRVRPPGAGA